MDTIEYATFRYDTVEVENNLYSRFQVTFQNAVAKFVLNIPNYITKFGILRAAC